MDKITEMTKLKHWTVVINEIIDALVPATSTTNGLLSKDDKIKLDGLKNTEFDTQPVKGSTNAVTSGGLYNKINPLESKVRQAQTDITSLDTRLDTAEQNVTKNTADIAALDEKINTFKPTATILKWTATSQRGVAVYDLIGDAALPEESMFTKIPEPNIPSIASDMLPIVDIDPEEPDDLSMITICKSEMYQVMYSSVEVWPDDYLIDFNNKQIIFLGNVYETGYPITVRYMK